MNKTATLKYFKNIPQLETNRLILRKMKPSDYLDMYEYAKQDNVTKYLLWSSHPNANYTYDYLSYVQSEYKSGKFFDWAIVCKQNNKMIGTCGFVTFDFDNNNSEIGYVLNPDYWNQGYATEAVKRIISFGFSVLNLHRIEARYMVGNDASGRVMEKCGMFFEGINRGSVFCKNNYYDVCKYAITSDDYKKYISIAKNAK